MKMSFWEFGTSSCRIWAGMVAFQNPSETPMRSLEVGCCLRRVSSYSSESTVPRATKRLPGNQWKYSPESLGCAQDPRALDWWMGIAKISRTCARGTFAGEIRGTGVRQVTTSGSWKGGLPHLGAAYNWVELTPHWCADNLSQWKGVNAQAQRWREG